MEMAKGERTPTLEQEKEPDKRPPWWKRLWARTGFGDKTVWDWLQLLIVPLVLVGIGLLFEMQQAERENRRAEAERELAEQRAQDEALQAYLNQMGQLILERNLLEAEENDPVYALAHARTRTILSRLDAEQNRTVTRFLTTTGLTGIERGGRPTISLLANIELKDANLSEAELIGADLSEAALSGADLIDADLSEADLSGASLVNADLRSANMADTSLPTADLRGADLSGADLSDATGITNEELEQQAQAYSLKGTTMPDGSVHP
jgi:hypothetical protein